LDFRDVLARRRMHRSFLPEPIPDEQVDRVVSVIRDAPSGGFTQGSSIIVVTDDAKRTEIAGVFGDEHYIYEGRNFLLDARVHLVVCANESLYHARYSAPDKLAVTGGVETTWPVPYWFVDAGALMMLVLEAVKPMQRPVDQLIHRERW
jgi:nitroreductase